VNADEGQDRQDNNHKTNEINNLVQDVSPLFRLAGAIRALSVLVAVVTGIGTVTGRCVLVTIIIGATGDEDASQAC
jgi:hypothetical protein